MCSMFVKADKSEFHATEVSFLRFANYYHRFICTYRSVAAPDSLILPESSLPMVLYCRKSLQWVEITVLFCSHSHLSRP